jgi:hypothetical protein
VATHQGDKNENLLFSSSLIFSLQYKKHKVQAFCIDLPVLEKKNCLTIVKPNILTVKYK